MVIVADLWGGMVGSIYFICAHIHFKTQVPMVHSCLLVNLKLEESDMLAYTPAKVVIVIVITITIVVLILIVVVVEMVKIGERLSRPSGRHDSVCSLCFAQRQPDLC